MNEFAPTFTFKRFAIDDRRCAMKVGTDGVLLGAWASIADVQSPQVADIGAGSGIIALMIAQRYPHAHITAVEIDPQAYSGLRLNVSMSPFVSQIVTTEGDYRSLTGTFDLIVSNPPYFIPGAGAPDISRCLAREAGELSPIGLLYYAKGHLTPMGRLAMIAPCDYDSEIEYHAALNALHPYRRTSVATSARRGVTRTLWEFTVATSPLPKTEILTIGSDEYRILTSPFYLNY